MGAEPWFYLVDYDEDINSVLQDLRQQEFLAGRYFPAMADFPLHTSPYNNFPLDSDPPSPGTQHSSIEAAIEDADADGTKSILDMQTVSASACRVCGTVSPLEDWELMDIFGTVTPSLSDLEKDDYEAYSDILISVGRGQAIYVILYGEQKPSKILFAGYSYD